MFHIITQVQPSLTHHLLSLGKKLCLITLKWCLMVVLTSHPCAANCAPTSSSASSTLEDFSTDTSSSPPKYPPAQSSDRDHLSSNHSCTIMLCRIIVVISICCILMLSHNSTGCASRCQQFHNTLNAHSTSLWAASCQPAYAFLFGGMSDTFFLYTQLCS